MDNFEFHRRNEEANLRAWMKALGMDPDKYIRLQGQQGVDMSGYVSGDDWYAAMLAASPNENFYTAWRNLFGYPHPKELSKREVTSTLCFVGDDRPAPNADEWETAMIQLCLKY